MIEPPASISLLYGWTGRELVFADAMIRFWDEKRNAEQ